MPLVPGTRLGTYEVLALLGQGGMGGVTADGQRFLLNSRVGSGSSPLTVILNWTSLVKR